MEENLMLLEKEIRDKRVGAISHMKEIVDNINKKQLAKLNIELQKEKRKSISDYIKTNDLELKLLQKHYLNMSIDEYALYELAIRGYEILLKMEIEMRNEGAKKIVGDILNIFKEKVPVMEIKMHLMELTFKKNNDEYIGIIEFKKKIREFVLPDHIMLMTVLVRSIFDNSIITTEKYRREIEDTAEEFNL